MRIMICLGCDKPNKEAYLAAKRGHINCLRAACGLNGHTFEERPEIAIAAARYGNLECLKYVYENGGPCNMETVGVAVQGNNLECLRYLHKIGCAWNRGVTYDAARHDSMECLRYLHENGCAWDSYTIYTAAWSGSPNSLRYAHENGCPWHKETAHAAGIQVVVGGKYIECLKYIYTVCRNNITDLDVNLYIKQHIEEWKKMVNKAKGERYYVPADIWNLLYEYW